MELFASSTMMMPQKENRDDGKIVIGGSVSTQTGYQAPRLKLFREYSSERQKSCLYSTAVKLATEATDSLLATQSQIESQLNQLKTLVDNYDKTPQFCLEMSSPRLIVTIKNQWAKAFRSGDKKAFDDWYKSFEIESIKIFSALDALTVKFAKPYALKKLIAEISKHPAVDYVENDAVFGGGPEVLEIQSPDLFIFREGWGDCFAGCIHGRKLTLQLDGKKVKEIERKEW